MSGLPNLIRLHKWKLDEQRRKLAEMETLARNFADQIRAVDARMAEENRIAQEKPEVAHVLGGFLEAARAQRARLESSKADVEREIAEMHERVSEAFRELKRFELTDQRRREERRAALRRRDRIREDEVGINLFRRKDDPGPR